ncbi:uncharacterized protein LOC141840983 isoform X1 [Curcuma longa]|uniref:uncharacterized protein LOC141840983 isoform X1 n=1 Tax=Curcuma longa TaxID=136217 RepID=UPI003D9EBBB3
MGAGDHIPSPAPTARAADARFSNPWKSPPTPATIFSPASATDKKVVNLFDWWLFEAEKHVDGKRLAVSGFTKRQQAARIFYSAPIVKRNDAYTIEAADGVIVLLDGMINKSRTQDNGFPLEMCNHFLVGFPYDWDHYIEGYYRMRATCNPMKLSSHDRIPVDSTYSAGKTSPVHLEEFSFGRVRKFLSSAGNKVTDSFIALQKIVSNRMDPEMQKFVSLPVDELSKRVDKNDGTMVGSVPSFKTYAEGPSTCHKQVAFSSLNENNAFPLTMSTQDTIGMQKKPSVINLHEMKIDNHLVPILNLEENIRTQDSLYLNEDAEGHNNSTGNVNILSNPLSKSLEFSNLNHSEKMPDSIAEILPCSSKSALETISSSDCLFSPTDLKGENVTSMKGLKFSSLKNSVHSDILESQRAKAYKEDNVRTGNVKGELGCIDFSKMPKDLCTRNAEKSTRDEINELCRSISEKIKSCSIPFVSPVAQKSSLIDNDLARGFDVDICSEKEPFVESTEKQERQEDLNQMQNQDCTKFTAQKHYKHCFAATGPLAVDGIGGESTSLKENLSTIQGPKYQILDGICTRSGRILSSPTVFPQLSGSKVKTVSSYNMKVKRVLKKSKVATTSMDTPNYKSDISKEEKLAFTYEDRGSMCKPALDLAITSEICNFDSFKEKLNASHVKYSQNLSSLPSDDMINELKEKTGFAIGHVGMENSRQENRSPFMKCAVSLDITAKVSSSKDKSTELFSVNLTNTTNNQDVKEPKVSKGEGCNKNKRLHTSRRKKMLSQSTYVQQSPLTREKARKLAMALPETFNLKRSRSGRLIVPQLDNGCQQIVYNADGTINGIKSCDMLCSPREGSKSAPPKRRKIITKS